MNGERSAATDRPLAIDGGRPIRETFLPFGEPSISEEEIQAIVDVLRSGWIGMGERTLEFERAFAEYTGARHAVAVSSCTAGLHVALGAAGIGAGDEVITTPLTFAATVNAILSAGATPVLVDVDRETLNIGPERVAAAITPRTRAILPVHFGGLPCDLAAFAELAEEHDLVIVEDAAHAIGALCDGIRIGGHGNLASFSFYPNKNMTSIEGGMVTTDDDDLAREVRLLRLHGLTSDAWRRFKSSEATDPRVVRLGYKYNLTDVQAALGLGQLSRLESFLAVREQYAEICDDRLADLPIDRQIRPPLGGPDRHALHLYLILLRLEELTVDRDQILRALRAENIGVAIHYAAIHHHPFYRTELDCTDGDFPVAEWVAERTLSLPLGPSMSEDDLSDVLEAVQAVLTRYRRLAGT